MSVALEEKVVDTRVVMTGHDRCDRCGAQAYIKATKDGSEIDFCAHHGRENKQALEAQGFAYAESVALEDLS